MNRLVGDPGDILSPTARASAKAPQVEATERIVAIEEAVQWSKGCELAAVLDRHVLPYLERSSLALPSAYEIGDGIIGCGTSRRPRLIEGEATSRFREAVAVSGLEAFMAWPRASQYASQLSGAVLEQLPSYHSVSCYEVGDYILPHSDWRGGVEPGTLDHVVLALSLNRDRDGQQLLIWESGSELNESVELCDGHVLYALKVPA